MVTFDSGQGLTIKDHALNYAKGFEWSVFPVHSIDINGACTCGSPGCSSPGKHPKTPNGLKDGSKDEATITGWFAGKHDVNIGIVTGKPSGIVVVDVDQDKGANVNDLLIGGLDQMIFNTLKVKTGGGLHFYYNLPPGVDIKTSASKLGQFIDIRANGGYVVGPPSKHVSGRNYVILNRDDFENLQLLDFPEQWIKRLESPNVQNGSSPLNVMPDQGYQVPDDSIQDGGRNNEMTRLAGKLRSFGSEEAEILAHLTAANQRLCKPPLDTRDLQKIAWSISKYAPKDSINASGGGAAVPSKKNRLKVVKLSTVTAKTVEWLWNPFIPRGFFTLCDGVEGIGKTYLMLKVAVECTKGGVLPGSSHYFKPGNVLLLSQEDSVAYVLKPRLDAMGADCDRVFALDDAFTLDSAGFDQLSDLIEEHDIKFALIDPIFSFTGKVNVNTDPEIRTITDALNRLAEKHNCSIVGIRHLNKSKGFGDPRNAGLNGVGWRAGSRSALLIGHDPDDKSKRAIAQTKLNIGVESKKVFGYQIKDDGEFVWTGESDLSLETMLSYKQMESTEERGAIGAAISFLRDQLGDGPKGATFIKDDAKKAGISEKTLQRAKDKLRIKSEKSKGNFASEWYWSLSDPSKLTRGDGQENDVGHLQSNGVSKPSYSNHLSEVGQPPLSDHLRTSTSGEVSQVGHVSQKKKNGNVQPVFGLCSCDMKGILGNQCFVCGKSFEQF